MENERKWKENGMEMKENRKKNKRKLMEIKDK